MPSHVTHQAHSQLDAVDESHPGAPARVSAGGVVVQGPIQARNGCLRRPPGDTATSIIWTPLQGLDQVERPGLSAVLVATTEVAGNPAEPKSKLTK